MVLVDKKGSRERGGRQAEGLTQRLAQQGNKEWGRVFMKKTAEDGVGAAACRRWVLGS